MTLSETCEAYVRIRAECVRCVITGDFERAKIVRGYLLALPSFHYEHRKETDNAG
jgi:hypothetical protein